MKTKQLKQDIADIEAKLEAMKLYAGQIDNETQNQLIQKVVGFGQRDAIKAVKIRDVKNRDLYKKMYGYILGKDLDDVCLTNNINDIAVTIFNNKFKFAFGIFVKVIRECEILFHLYLY